VATSKTLECAIGRPRNHEVERTVHDAVLELIGEGATLTSLSLVTISRRAGISRNTFYRRWRSKDELYSDVLTATNECSLAQFKELSARDTITKLLNSIFARVADQHQSRIEWAINAEAQSFPDLYTKYLAEIVTPRANALKLAIRRGKETGEIRVDVDENLLTDLLLSLSLAGTYSGLVESLDTEAAGQRFTDLVFDGVAPD